MTRARDVANVLSTATSLATDTETAAAISSHNTAANGHTTRGNTAGRPASPTVGDVYINTENGVLEIYESTGWTSVVSPSVPSSVVATNQGSGRAYNSGQASIAFSTGTFAGTTYTITSSPGSYTASGSSSPITITGLQSSTQYTYTAVASSKYGISLASSASTGVTATTVPQAPTIGTATAADSSATLTFTAGETGGSSITNYKYSTNNSTYTAFSPAQTSSPLTISGLTNGTSYSFYLKAVNANGDSTASAASNSVIPDNTAYESIQTITVGSGGSSSIEFTSIPATYTHLQIRGIARSTNGSVNGISVNMQFNSDTAGNYSQHYLGTYQGSGSATESVGAANTSNIYIGAIPNDGLMASLYSGHTIDILDYKDTNKYKTVKTLGGYDFNGATTGYSYLNFHSGNWRNTNAITSIKLFGASGDFKQYTQFALYGIKGS